VEKCGVKSEWFFCIGLAKGESGEVEIVWNILVKYVSVSKLKVLS